MATTFVGRGPEIAEALRLLKRSRLVTLTGAGGVGKTRLARRLLDDARELPVELTVLVDLEPLTEPEVLPHAVARSLGLEEDPARPAVPALATWFRRRPALLVLDTSDRLVDAVAELAVALLRAVPDLRILTTGRQPLGVPGEHVHIVRPLPPDDAAALLRDRLGAPDALPSADAAELCALLDHLPLAIELAAEELRARPAYELIDALRRADRSPLGLPERPDGPPEPSDDRPAEPEAPPRHRDMRATIGWSHELCSPRERLLWARLSVFDADIEPEAAEYVCAGGPLPAAAVLDTLGALVDKSVLFTCDLPDGVRYRMLRGVRRFGVEWLDRLGERDETRRRHDDYREWRNERGTR